MTVPLFGASMSSIETVQNQDLPQFSKPGGLDSSPSSESTPTASNHTYLPFRPPPYQTLAYHRYRTSTSTSSTTSSPTTTASLLGPTPTSETPGTSPDTPASSKSYTGPFYRNSSPGAEASPEPRFGSMSAGPRKAKNPKNLALNNLASSPSLAPASPPPSAGGGTASDNESIFSPSFVKPPPPRRKSTALGLTLQTPSSDTFAAAAQLQQVPVPPTPSLLRTAALRPFQSTPSLPLQAVAAHRSLEAQPAIPQFTSNFTDFPADETDDLREPEGKLERPDAYPDGPVCIYDPHVFLYYEPTAEEAAKYDVIFNVASEVRNPFLQQQRENINVADIRTAVESLSGDRSFSVTPTDMHRRPSSETRPAEESRTEYFHIPWEHNSDMVAGTSFIPPLRDIIKVVDDRVSEGKRVLIHCQLGVSRSASLIVAYGLYKNQTMSVQEVYAMVKERSKWIGPNMGLIMQLQEYRNDLLKPSPASKGHQKSTSRILHGRKDIDDPHAPDTSVPQTAPLPQDASPTKSVPSPLQTDSMPNVSAGPSSAPSDFNWPSAREVGDVEQPASDGTSLYLPSRAMPVGDDSDKFVLEDRTQRREQTQRGAPLSNRTDSTSTLPHISQLGPLQLPLRSAHLQEALESPRSAEFAMSPLKPVDDDPTFGLTSPREATFASSPFRADASTFAASPVQFSPFSTSPPQQLPMAPMSPPDDEIMLGLSSPRATGFSSQMPSYFQTTPPRVVHLAPSIESTTTSAQERAELRSNLGFRHTMSTENMQAALSTGHASPARPRSPLIVPPRQDEPDLADALMSPRATEFTKNPFHDALAEPSEIREQHSQSSPAPITTQEPKLGAAEADVRSPPLKGSSPINRSIFDVIDS